jgi:hypothetical protein
MFDLDTLPTIDPANRIHLERYIRHLELRQLRLHTVRTKVWRVYPFLKVLAGAEFLIRRGEGMFTPPP